MNTFCEILAQSDPDKVTLIYVAAVVFGIAFVIWIISAGVRSGMKKAKQDTDAPTSNHLSKPGLFKINGVDRATKMDTSWNVQATSEANAKVKAELEGIIVTDVTRI